MQILYNLLIYNARLSQCEFRLSVGILVAFSIGTKLPKPPALEDSQFNIRCLFEMFLILSENQMIPACTAPRRVLHPG